MYQILWLIAIIAFIVLEAVTYQMICIWFILGAIAALFASMLDIAFIWQMTVFVLLSVVLLICFRPLVVKKLKPTLKTNADSAIGKKVVITQEVNNTKGTGEAKLDGLLWTARSENDKTLAQGEIAEVVRIEGVKLIVS